MSIMNNCLFESFEKVPTFITFLFFAASFRLIYSRELPKWSVRPRPLSLGSSPLDYQELGIHYSPRER